MVLEEIAMVEDTPHDLVHDIAAEAVFGGPRNRVPAWLYGAQAPGVTVRRPASRAAAP